MWPCQIDSYDGFKYFMMFIDDYSRVTWIYLLNSKNDVCHIFKDFHSMVTTQFDNKIKGFCSNNGPKLQRAPFMSFFVMKTLFIKLFALIRPNKWSRWKKESTYFGDYKSSHTSNEYSEEILITGSSKSYVLDQ